MRANISLAFVLSAIHGARFGLGIWVLYYLRFTNFAGIGLIETLMMLTAFALEIPSGALADLVGRKRSLQAAFALYATGMIFLASAKGFGGLCAGVLIFIAGKAFYSGSFEALLYDSLEAEGRSELYLRTLSAIAAMNWLCLAVTCVCGGYLYAWSPRAPYWATALTFALGFLITCFLREPPSRDRSSLSAMRFLRQTLDGLADLMRPLRSRNLIALLILAGMVMVIGEEVLDDVLAVAFGFRETQLGWLFAGVYLLAAMASKWGGCVARERVVALILALFALSALSFCLSPWLGLIAGGATVMFRYGARAMLANYESEIINRHARASNRATRLSAFALLKSGPYLVLAYWVGSLMDGIGARAVAFACGLLLFGILAMFAGPAFRGRLDALTRRRSAQSRTCEENRDSGFF